MTARRTVDVLRKTGVLPLTLNMAKLRIFTSAVEITKNSNIDITEN